MKHYCSYWLSLTAMLKGYGKTEMEVSDAYYDLRDMQLTKFKGSPLNNDQALFVSNCECIAPTYEELRDWLEDKGKFLSIVYNPGNEEWDVELPINTIDSFSHLHTGVKGFEPPFKSKYNALDAGLQYLLSLIPIPR